MKIIGITGTLGAGKGTIVEYLIEKKDFIHYSVRQFLTEEINRQQLPLNRDSMVLVANNLRKQHHPAYIIDTLYQQAEKINKNAIIESIRTPAEVISLREKSDFYLLAVDADPQIRYNRIIERNSETDHVSFEEFLSNEQREMQNDDINKQNLKQCIAMADYVLNNNNTIADLHKNIELILSNID